MFNPVSGVTYYSGKVYIKLTWEHNYLEYPNRSGTELFFSQQKSPSPTCWLRAARGIHTLLEQGAVESFIVNMKSPAQNESYNAICRLVGLDNFWPTKGPNVGMPVDIHRDPTWTECLCSQREAGRAVRNSPCWLFKLYTPCISGWHSSAHRFSYWLLVDSVIEEEWRTFRYPHQRDSTVTAPLLFKKTHAIVVTGVLYDIV